MPEYTVRALWRPSELALAAELIARTRTEFLSGRLPFNSTLAHATNRLHDIRTTEHGRVWGGFHDGKLVFAAAIGPLLIRSHGDEEHLARQVAAHVGKPVRPKEVGLLTGMSVDPQHRGKKLSKMLDSIRLPWGMRHWKHLVAETVHAERMRGLEKAGFRPIAVNSYGRHRYTLYHLPVKKA